MSAEVAAIHDAVNDFGAAGLEMQQQSFTDVMDGMDTNIPVVDPATFVDASEEHHPASVQMQEVVQEQVVDITPHVPISIAEQDDDMGQGNKMQRGRRKSLDEGEYSHKRMRKGSPSKRATDLEVTDTLIKALQVYSSFPNRQLDNIPKNFKIPKDEPETWSDESLWGFDLGQRIFDIRTNFTLLDEDSKKRLEEVGLDFYDFKYKVVPFEIISLAFKTYSRVAGDLNTMSTTFSVPKRDPNWPEETWGLKLGSKLADIRACDTFSRHKDELAALGIDLSKKPKKAVPPEIVLEALKVYKKLNGDLRIPHNFIIPAQEPWPENTHGVSLDGKIDSIKRGNHARLRSQYEELGIDFGAQKQKELEMFENTHKAVSIYSQVNGNVDVPKSYVIDQNDMNYPAELSKFKLGKFLYHICNNPIFEPRYAELEAVGIVIKVWQKTKFEAIKLALQTFKRIYNTNSVGINFTVPENHPDWPPETWGVDLGTKLYHIRFSESYADRKDEMMEIGFKVHSGPKVRGESRAPPSPKRIRGKEHEFTFDDIYNAIVWYGNIHGNYQIPGNFVVPKVEDTTWPAMYRGLRLGSRVHNYRQLENALTDDQRERLIGLGMNLDPVKKMTYRKRMPVDQHVYALELYIQFFGTVDVPRGFVVPEEERWPKNLWGFHLGESLRNIKRGGFATHSEKFRELGINLERSKRDHRDFKKRKLVDESSSAEMDQRHDIVGVEQMTAVPQQIPQMVADSDMTEGVMISSKPEAWDEAATNAGMSVSEMTHLEQQAAAVQHAVQQQHMMQSAQMGVVGQDGMVVPPVDGSVQLMQHVYDTTGMVPMAMINQQVMDHQLLQGQLQGQLQADGLVAITISPEEAAIMGDISIDPMQH